MEHLGSAAAILRVALSQLTTTGLRGDCVGPMAVCVQGGSEVPGRAAGLSRLPFSLPSGQRDGCEHLHPRGLSVHEGEEHR